MMKQSSRFMRSLTSDVHFYTAQMGRVPIVVFIAGELIGSGKIMEITKDSIKVGNDRYFRSACTFKYAI
ncbi:Uncharacterised protein [Paenibacillus macerans]|uniref:Uncharacterized protein n=1 Tax=Paenibacillus macerans TaxID=44252 RepID=A0A090YLF2_PAEMA|nr:hypothetical protein DJ90_2917 [Paenibacillus macerans]SUA84769.1 Uncharacterised protein [Paenibacillus macerans]